MDPIKPTLLLPEPKITTKIVWKLSRSRAIRAYHRLPKMAQRTLAIFTIIATIFPFYLFGPFHNQVEAAWFDESYLYRQKTEISNSGSNQTDFQVSFALDTATLITAGKMQSDCDDIRVTDVNGQLLPHWIEEGSGPCNDASTDVWVKVPSIETSGATLYVYYGNSGVNNVENGEEVFEFFDDFSSPTVDTNKWAETRSDPAITSNALDISSTSDITILHDTLAAETTHTGNTNWTDVADSVISAGSFKANTKYLIFAWGYANGSNTANRIGVRLVHGTEATPFEQANYEDVPTASGATRKEEFAFMFEYTQPATTEDIQLQFATFTAASTVRVEHVNIFAIEVDTLGDGNYYYAEDDDSQGDFVPNTTTMATRASLTFTPENANDTWLVIGSLRGDIDNTSSDFEVQIEHSADTAPFATDEGRDVNEDWATVLVRPYTLAASSQTFNLQVRDDSAAANDHVFSALAAIRLENFETSASFYNAAEQALTLSTLVEVGNIDPAVVTTGNGFLLGYAVSDLNTINNRQEGRLTVDGTITPTSIDNSDFSGNGSDNAIEIPFLLATDQSFTAGTRDIDFDVQWDNDAGVDPAIEDRAMAFFSERLKKEGIRTQETFASGSHAVGFRTQLSSTTAGDYRIGFTNTASINSSTSTDDSANLYVGTGASDLRLDTSNEGTLQSSANFTTKNTSYHTYEIRSGASNTTIYQDGTLKATNSTQVPNEDSYLRIENDNVATAGTLSTDWVYVRKSAATEPSAAAAGSEEQSAGPVAHWAFNQGQGTIAEDSTINANNGALAGASWQQEDLCLNEKCLYFDGTNDYSTSGLSFTHLVSTTDDSGTSITSASISPEPNSLLLVYSVGRNGTDPGVPTATDTLTGTGTWAEAGASRFQVTAGGDTRTSVHYAKVGSSPGSGTVNVAFGELMLNMSVDIVQVTGFDPNSPIVQAVVSDLASGATHTVTISSFADTLNNAAIGFFVQPQVSGSATPGSGFTELHDTVHTDAGGSTHTSESEYKIGEDTSVDVTWANTDSSIGYALEIAANAKQDQFDFAAADDFTISGWFKHNTQSSGQDVIAAKYESTGADGGYKLLMEADGDITFAIDDENTAFPDDSATSTAATYDDNKWHHVAGVKDGTTSISLYIDGVLIATDSTIAATGTLANDDALFIGIDGDGASNDWLGFLDDMKIYNYARTAAQIKTDYNARGGSIGAGAVLGARDQSFLSDGLQGYWKMDEASWTVDCSTTSVTDSSGNGNNGASCPLTTGPTGGAAGKFDSGGDFDGTDDYVAVGAVSTAPTGTEARTISTWFNADAFSTGTGDTIFSSTASGAAGTQLDVYAEDNAVSVGFSSHRVITPKSALSIDTWYHVAVVIPSGATQTSDVLVYIDGELQALTDESGSSQTLNTATSDVNIGSSGASLYFNGTLDDVRLYSRAFSATEARDLYNFAPAPIGYWDFNENTGTTANDISGNGNTGTINGATWTKGRLGTGLSFDGSNDYVDAGTGIAPDHAISICSWYYSRSWGSAAADQDIIVRTSTANTGNFVFEFNNDLRDSGAHRDLLFDAGGIGGTAGISGTGSDIDLDEWNHLCVTYEESSDDAVVYINGRPTYQNVPDLFLPTASETLYIGGRTGSTDVSDAVLDDVKIYNYVRTNNQILEDMNGNHPVGGSPIGSKHIHWRFDEQYGTTANNDNQSWEDGTISGAAWLTSSSCKYNGCLNFDTSTDYVSAGNITAINADEEFSTSLWVNPQTLATQKAIISQTNFSTQNLFAVVTDSTNSDEIRVYIASAVTDSSNYFTTTNLDLTGSTWQHLAVTYNGNAAAADRVKVYKDGRPIAGSVTGTIPATTSGGATSNFKVGASDDTVTYTSLISYMDDIKLYNSAITQNAVLVDFNAGSALGASVGQDEAADLTDGAGNPPVAHWNFDENTGTSLNDISGSGNTGTLTNMTASDWIPGKLGSALDFDGSNDFVNAGSAAALDDINPITIAAWIYNRSVGTDPRIYVKANSGGTQGGAMLLIPTAASTQLEFRHGFATTKGRWRTPTNSILANRWYHVAVTFDNTSASNDPLMYIDGISQTVSEFETPSGATDSDATYDAIIGNRPDATRPWDGYIDELKIYDYIRTPAQIIHDYNRGSPIAHWKLDECTGTTAYDSAPKTDPNVSRNDGTITIGATGSNTTAGTCTSPTDGTGAWYDGRTGKFNSSLDFDGTDDYIDATNNDCPTLPCSVSGWINPNSLPASDDEGIFRNNENTTQYDGIGIFLDSTGKIHVRLGDGAGAGSTNRSDFFTTVSSVTTSTWLHFSVVATSMSDVAIYVNGQSQALTTSGTASTYSSGTGTSNIGRGWRSVAAGVTYFDGKIDDLQVHNYSLSAAQIRKIMNQNAAIRFGPATGSP